MNKSLYNVKIGIAVNDGTWHTEWINFIEATNSDWAFERVKTAVYNKYGEDYVCHIWLIEFNKAG